MKPSEEWELTLLQQIFLEFDESEETLNAIVFW